MDMAVILGIIGGLAASVVPFFAASLSYGYVADRLGRAAGFAAAGAVLALIAWLAILVFGVPGVAEGYR